MKKIFAGLAVAAAAPVKPTVVLVHGASPIPAVGMASSKFWKMMAIQ